MSLMSPRATGNPKKVLRERVERREVQEQLLEMQDDHEELYRARIEDEREVLAAVALFRDPDDDLEPEFDPDDIYDTYYDLAVLLDSDL
jgi:hypothetical protein